MRSVKNKDTNGFVRIDKQLALFLCKFSIFLPPCL